MPRVLSVLRPLSITLCLLVGGVTLVPHGKAVEPVSLPPIVPDAQPIPLPADFASPPRSPNASNPQLVVLKSGKVMEGLIREEVLGYIITTTNGEVLIPFDMVRVAATSFDDAYERMRENFINPTANERIELAAWCLENGVMDAARAEVLAALRLEPERREARKLLQQIELRTVDPAITASLAPAKTRQVLSVDPRSTGNLSRQSTAMFVRQVQPLLLNRCGNARCHGSASNSRLKFETVSPGRINRYETDINLSRVLGFLDPSSPEESLLLTRAMDDIGPHHGLFSNPRTETQKRILTEWVMLTAPQSPQPAMVSRPVAAESPATSPTVEKSIEREHPVPSPLAASHLLLQPIPISGVTPAHTASETVPKTTRTPQNHVDEAFLRKILEEEQPDAFDPQKFNRMVHGVESNVPKTQPPTRSPTQQPQ